MIVAVGLASQLLSDWVVGGWVDEQCRHEVTTALASGNFLYTTVTPI